MLKTSTRIIPQFSPANCVESQSIDQLCSKANALYVYSQKDIEKSVAIIRKWGWIMPIAVDAHGEIISGHCRLLAAKSLGMSTIPVLVAREWTDEKIRAHRLADEQLSSLENGIEDDTI